MVWPNFPLPLSSLVSDIVFATRDHTFLLNPLISETIDNHCLNQVIQIVVPVIEDVDNVKRLLRHHCPLLSRFLLDKKTTVPGRTSINDATLSYARIRQAPIHLLLHPSFIKNFVLKGSVMLLSECSIDQDDCMAVLPDGVIHISLRSSSYHRFGLVGHESIMNAKKSSSGDRYIIWVDLKDPLITQKFEKQKYFLKLFTSFHNSGIRFDLIVRWIPEMSAFPPGQVPSPESISNFFQLMKDHPEDGCGFMSQADASGISIETCCPSVRTFENHKQILPDTLLEFKDVVHNDDLMEGLVMDAEDWIGSQLCSLSSLAKDDNNMDVNSFGFDPSSCQVIDSVLCTEVYGFFSPIDVRNLLTELDSQIDLLSRSIPFISVTVSGFENSLISWSSGERAEHGKDVSGENSYTMVMSCKSHPIPRSVAGPAEKGDSGSMQEEEIRKVLMFRRADAYDFSIQRL